MVNTLIITVILGVGVLFMLHFFYLIILSRQTINWIPIKCRIEKSELEVFNQSLGTDSNVFYKANIRYQYILGEKMYSSKRIFIGDFIGKNFPHSAKILINKYRKNREVIAYYDPKHPNKSVLETGVHTVIYRELFISVFFIILSIILWQYPL